MSKVIARTRLRGTIDYRQAEWIENYFGEGLYGVRFLDDPTGHIYHAAVCHRAKD